MDPLSITLAVGTICKAVYSISKYLNDIKNGTDKASQAARDLADEVNTWYNTLHTVEIGLKNPQIQAVEQSEQDEKAKQDGHELWRSVAESVEACTGTIDKLQKGIKSLQTTNQTTLPQQVWQRMKLNLKDNEMIGLRTQVRTHTNALQLVLQIINVRAAYMAPGSVVSELGPMIEALSKTMLSLQESVAKQQPLEDEEDFSNATTLIGSRYTDDLNTYAQKVLSSAKTVCEEKSVKDSSLWGDMDSLARERTESWIKEPRKGADGVIPTLTDEPAPIPGTLPRTPDTSNSTSPPHPDGKPLDVEPHLKSNDHPTGLARASSDHNDAHSDSSLTFVSTNQLSSEPFMPEEDEINDTDSENDFEYEEAKLFLQEGAEEFHKGHYSEAREILHVACQQARSLSIKQQRQIDLGERHLMLAICIYHAGDLDIAERHLSGLTKENISRSDSTEKDAVRLCQASHLLAQVYLRKKQLDAAKDLCRKALIGRHRIVGKQDNEDQAYNESLYLLSVIEEESGNAKVAEIRRKMIPTKLTAIVTDSVQKSLKGEVESTPGPQRDVQQDSTQSSSDRPSFKSPRLSDFSFQSVGDSSDGAEAQSLVTTSASDNVETPDDLKQIQPIEITDEPDPSSPPNRAPTHSSLGFDSNNGGIGSIDPSHLEVSNLKILKEFVKYMPSKHRQTRDLVNLDKLDNAVPSSILAWLERFSVDWDPFMTPLHVAAAVGHTEVLTTLLDRGLSPDSRMSKDHICARRIPHYAECTPLHLAATYGRAGITRILLGYGASINALDWKKKSAVHYAARVGVSALLELLLHHDADVSIKDADERTPLMIAAINGHARFLNVLVDSGVNVEEVDYHKNSALHFAAGAGQLEIVRILLDRGMELETMNIVWHTPLQRAVEKGHVEVAQLLLDKGADIESRDVLGRTPLHTAGNYGMAEIVKLLLDSGANASAKDVHNKTPRELACDRLHTTAESVLKKYDKKKEKDAKDKEHPKSPTRRRFTWSKKSNAPKDNESLSERIEHIARQGSEAS